MGRTIEKLSAQLELPAIPAGQELVNVPTGLVLADGTDLSARLCGLPQNLAITSNGDGTINVTNTGEADIEEGQIIAVTAIDRYFLPEFPSAEAVGVAPTTISVSRLPVPFIGVGFAAASSTLQGANINAPISLFNFTNPASKAGILEVNPGDNAGALRILKKGTYLILLTVNFRVRSGGAGVATLGTSDNGAGITARKSIDVNFTGGLINHQFQHQRIRNISQASLDANGGKYDINYSLNTNDVTIDFSFDNSSASVPSGATLQVFRFRDF